MLLRPGCTSRKAHTHTHAYTQRRCSISIPECIPKTVTVIRCAIRWVRSLKGWKSGGNLSKNCQLWSKICLNVEVTTLPRFMTQLSSELLVSQVWGEVEASVFTRKVNYTRITEVYYMFFFISWSLWSIPGDFQSIIAARFHWNKRHCTLFGCVRTTVLPTISVLWGTTGNYRCSLVVMTSDKRDC